MVTFSGIARTATQSAMATIMAARKAGLINEQESYYKSVKELADMNTLTPNPRQSVLGLIIGPENSLEKGISVKSPSVLGKIGPVDLSRQTGLSASEMKLSSLVDIVV